MAGQVGLSITLVRAISSLASSFISSKISVFNIRVAKWEIEDLNKQFRSLQWRSVLLLVVASVSLIALCMLLLPYFGWEHRLVSLRSLALLSAAELSMLITSNYAVYLRAFKREPYMWLSVINGIGSAASILLGFYLTDSVEITAILYLIVQLCIFALARYIFVTFRRKPFIGTFISNETTT